MPRLTQDLIDCCYRVLCRCDAFQSKANLAAVFVSEELYPFRDRLRDAEHLDARVKANVDYLLYQNTEDRRPVFPIFLQALRPASQGDSLYSDLDDLSSKFGQALGQEDRIHVPYVVAAMKRAEADALQSDEVFRDPHVAPIDADRFRAVQAVLPAGWVEDYQERRDDWTLHADHQSVIGTVLGDMLAHVNRCLRQPENLALLDGVSFSEQFFSAEQRDECWQQLRQSGGIFIIDAISLFYPPIRQALLKSALVPGRQMAALVLSPLDFHAAPANEHIAALVKDEMPTVFESFALFLDDHCEMGTGDVRGLERWLFRLFASPQDMAATIAKNRVDSNRLRARNRMPAPTGEMGKALYGGQA